MALTADEFLDAVEPAAPALTDLGGLRSSYIGELQDPEVARRLYSLTEREVGSQGPEAQQAFMESVFNRAAARGLTLAQTVSDRDYYPSVSFRPVRLPTERIEHYNTLAADVAQGSNVANFATGNASGSVGFAGGPQTFRAGGERFGIEGPDKGWARSLEDVRRGKPVEEVIEPVRIEKAIPIKVREVEVRRAIPVAQTKQSADDFLDAPEPAAPAPAQQPAAPETKVSLGDVDAFLDDPEITAEQATARAYSQTPEARAELQYPEGSPEAEAIKRARPLYATQVPATTAAPTAEEALTRGIAQATQVTPPAQVEIPRRIGGPTTVPEAYEEAGGGIAGTINALDFAAKSPILDKDQARQLVAMSGARDVAALFGQEKAGRITEERAADILSQSSTPAGIAQMALLKIPVARALFAGQLVDATAQDLGAMKTAYDKGDHEGLTQAITDAVAHAGLTAALAAGEGQLARRSGYFRTEVTGVGPPVYERPAMATALPEARAGAAEAPGPGFEALPPAERPALRAPREALPAIEAETLPAVGTEALPAEAGTAPAAPAQPALAPGPPPRPALPEPVPLILDTSIPANERYGMLDQLKKLGYSEENTYKITTAQARAVLQPEAPTGPARPEGELEPAMSADDFLDAPAQVSAFRPRTERPLTKREIAEREHQAELLRSGREEIAAQGGMDLLEAVAHEGRLPGIGHRWAEPYRGELKMLREAIRGTKGVRFRDVFATEPRGNVDDLLLRLRARGFDIETPHQLIDAIQARILSGKPHYGLPEMGETLYGGGRVAEPAPEYKRQFPAYSLEELKQRVEKAPAETKAKMRAEIEAREAGVSKPRITPQLPTRPARARAAAAAATPELFGAEQMPFTLRGEELTQEVTPEGAARAQAEAGYQQKKAQLRLFDAPARAGASVTPEHINSYIDRENIPPDRRQEAYDGISGTIQLSQNTRLAPLYAGEQGELFGGGIAGVSAKPPQAPSERAVSQAEGFAALQAGQPRTVGAALAQNKNRLSIIIPELVKGETIGFDIQGTVIAAPVDFAMAVQTLRSPWKESLKAIARDPKTKRVLGSEIVHVGTLNESLAIPRDMLRIFALLKDKFPNAELLFSHNHPSGDPNPSDADRRLNVTLHEAADRMGTKIVDHVITNGTEYYSFTQEEVTGDGVGKLPEAKLQPWEILRQREMPKIQEPEQFQKFAQTLRNDDPNAAHIFYVGTRMNLNGVERVAAGFSVRALQEAITAGISRNGAYGILVDLPIIPVTEGVGTPRLLDKVQAAALAMHVKLLDASWPGMESVKSAGLIAEEAGGYGAGAEPPPPRAPRVAETPEEQGKYRRFAERFQQDQRIAQDIRDATGNREYEPIPNDVTAEQARQLVNSRPISDVINAIKDEANGLPFHIRSTMGQQVILRLNEAYKNLERNGVAKDAETIRNQAIDMAEWQLEYGTRLGQGVQSFAMWERLTPAGKLMAVQRRVRATRRRYSGQHPGEVEQITNVLNGAGNAAEKLAALKKLFGRNRTARKAKPYMQKLIEAAKSGHFTDQDFYDIASERLGLPKYDKATAAEIMKMAHKIDDAPEGIPKDQATLDLHKYIATKMGFRPADLPIGIYYGNMLSGYNTQIVNAVDTFVNVLGELGATAMANPRAGMKIFSNAARGFKEGTADALLALTRGRMLTDEKWMDQPRLMEVAKFGQKGGVPITTATRTGRVMKRLAEARIAKPLNAWKYVSRLMAASDSVMFRGAKEGRAALLADRAAREEGLKGGALHRRVQELLGRTSDQLRDVAHQAEQEGFKGAAKVARMTELRTRLRDSGANADATDFAGMATYNHEPRGMLGYFAKQMGRASEKFPILKLAVPFTRIVANVTNRGLNYTPWGFKRAFRGYSGDPPPKGDERAAHISRAIMGTAGLGLLWALQQKGAITINGAGPSDPERRRQLQQAGWRPYTLKIGDKYWSYIYTPIGLGLSIIGNMSDSIRYGELTKQGAMMRAGYALSRVGSTIFSQSFLSGLTNLFDSLSGGGSPGQTMASIRRQVSTTAGTMSTPRIVMDVQRLFDPRQFDSNTIGQDLLKNTPFAALTNKPVLNAFGEPVKLPTNRFVFPVTKDLAWQLVTSRNMRVPVPDKYTTMPDGRGGSRQITPDEYYEYLSKTGPALKEWILRRAFMMQYGDPEKMQRDMEAKGQEIREPVLRRLRVHARYNPVN